MLLKKLPDTSEYKTWSERNGDNTEAERVAMETFNELAQLHHTTQALFSDPEKWKDYDPPRYLSRVDRVKFWSEAEEQEQEQAQAIDSFSADIGDS